MSNLSFLKKSIIAPVLLATAFTSQAGVLDENTGLRSKIRCDEPEVMTMLVAKKNGQISTGLKASNENYDMEIYANKETETWTLVGVNKKPKDKYDSICVLQTGSAGAPYTAQKFYAVFFKDADKPRIAAVPQDPKPNLN